VIVTPAGVFKTGFDGSLEPDPSGWRTKKTSARPIRSERRETKVPFLLKTCSFIRNVDRHRVAWRSHAMSFYRTPVALLLNERSPGFAVHWKKLEAILQSPGQIQTARAQTILRPFKPLRHRLGPWLPPSRRGEN